MEQLVETDQYKEEWGIGAGEVGVRVDKKGRQMPLMRKFLGKQKHNVRPLSA